VKIGEIYNGEWIKLYVRFSHSFVRLGDSRLRNNLELKITDTKGGDG